MQSLGRSTLTAIAIVMVLIISLLEHGGIIYSHSVAHKPLSLNSEEIQNFFLSSGFLLLVCTIPILLGHAARSIKLILALIGSTQFFILFQLMSDQAKTDSNVFLMINGVFYLAMALLLVVRELPSRS